MIESITLITLAFLFLVFFRPGKTPPLNNPLVIERPGQYHMTLAPQLNLAQPLIEAIAKLIGPSGDATKNSATQYFEVRDKQVTAHGSDFYLLAITRRNCKKWNGTRCCFSSASSAAWRRSTTSAG